MKAAYVEMIGGAAGDMLAAAFVDAGADFNALEAAVRTIGLGGWRIERQSVLKGGVAATYLDVIVPGEDGRHGEHGAAPHAHRTLAQVREIVASSGLRPAQKARAERIYTRLGEAEARAHGTDLASVAFHEVGQIDAIVDVAMTCVALDLLGIERLYCSAYPIGRGTIAMHHGRYPNPPPATAELLRGAPTYDGGIEGEMVTTTAAAILATLVEQPGVRPAMTWERIGYGAGRCDFSIPNVTRIVVGELAGAAMPLDAQRLVVLEASIDDMSPQFFELAFERLFAAGALDVWTTPIAMKKSRPGILLAVLAPPEAAGSCAQTLLRETTTLGVRRHEVERLSLPREVVTVETPLGAVRIKRALLNGSSRTTIEYDDLVRIARERERPIGEIARLLAPYAAIHDAGQPAAPRP